MAHLRQSGPVSGLGFQAKVLKPFEIVSSLNGRGDEYLVRDPHRRRSTSFVLNRHDLYHRSLDSGEIQYKSRTLKWRIDGLVVPADRRGDEYPVRDAWRVCCFWACRVMIQRRFTPSACERRGSKPNGCKNFYLKAKASIWPRLSCMCNIRLTAELPPPLQTDEVINIPCGTRGGVLISFDKVRPRRERGRDGERESARERESEGEKRGGGGTKRQRGSFFLQEA